MNKFDMFSTNVFTEEYLKKRISKKNFEQYKQMINNEIPFNKKLAQKVLDVIKNWAIEKGATHYSHWFQPLSGAIAEKQTSFLSIDSENQSVL